MESTSQFPFPGSKQLNLKKSFKLALRCLLTSSSKEEFCKAFPRFTTAEQERLHRLFIEVITVLHQGIEDELESVCLETKVGIALDTVEQLVEEHSLDTLFPDKTNVENISQYMSTAKNNEIQYLTGMLEKAEEQKRFIKSRVELLKKERQDFSGATDAIEKLRNGILNYGTSEHATVLRSNDP